MSLLTNILRNPENEPAKKVAYLVNIIRELGWDSLTDTKTIKPNLRKTQLYLRRNNQRLIKLFKIDFTQIARNDLVDTINPLLIEIWHAQIIGTPDAASLQLLQPK